MKESERWEAQNTHKIDNTGTHVGEGDLLHCLAVVVVSLGYLGLAGSKVGAEEAQRRGLQAEADRYSTLHQFFIQFKPVFRIQNHIGWLDPYRFQ